MVNRMADLLIKGMETPKDCPQCPLSHWNKLDRLTGCDLVWRHVPESETDYWQINTRPDWCPLVEIPPHGRLIDSSELLATITECAYTIGLQFDEVVFGMRLDDIVRMVLNAPTVIEASDSNALNALDAMEADDGH